jgi:hypothetical protein
MPLFIVFCSLVIKWCFVKAVNRKNCCQVKFPKNILHMQMSEKRIDLAKSMPKPIDNQVPELNV